MTPAAPERRGRFWIEAGGVCLGLILFALFSHRGLPWIAAGAAGLAAAAFWMQRSFASLRNIPSFLGLSAPSLRVLPISLIGCAAGAGLGAYYRVSFSMTAFPDAPLAPFAIVACCIGAAEELIYRGWMQGRLRNLGRPLAVLAAAAAHAAYKTALFAFPPQPARVDYFAIAALTLAGGAVFGVLRELSGSVIPAVAGHAAFDLMVYGTMAQAPWWVW